MGKISEESFLQKEIIGYVCLALPEVFTISYQEMSVLVIFPTDAKFLTSIIPPQHLPQC